MKNNSKEKIKELEKTKKKLKNKMIKLISKPINEESIIEAREIGAEIISEAIDNQIILDLLYWDEYPDKLSESAKKFKSKNG